MQCLAALGDSTNVAQTNQTCLSFLCHNPTPSTSTSLCPPCLLLWLHLFLSPFFPLFLWKSIGTRLWEEPLCPKGSHSPLDRSQASFPPSR